MATKSETYQAMTRDAFRKSAGGILDVAAAVLVRAQHEGGPSKSFRTVLLGECTADGVPEGTFKPIYASVARIFDEVRGTVITDAEPSDQRDAMREYLTRQFKTASAFLAYRSPLEIAKAATAKAEKVAETASKAADAAAEAAAMAAAGPVAPPQLNLDNVLLALSGADLTSQDAARVIQAMVPLLARQEVAAVSEWLARRLTGLDLITANAAEINAEPVGIPLVGIAA